MNVFTVNTTYYYGNSSLFEFLFECRLRDHVPGQLVNLYFVLPPEASEIFKNEQSFTVIIDAEKCQRWREWFRTNDVNIYNCLINVLHSFPVKIINSR